MAAFASSRDGTKLATAGADKTIRVWNAADGKLIKEIATGEPIVAVAFHQDGSQLAAALANKSVRIYAVGDGKELKKVEGLPSPITALRLPRRWRTARLGRRRQCDPRREFRRRQDDQGAEGALGTDSRPGIFTQGRQPARVGFGGQDRQAVGCQSRQERSRFRRAWRCGPQRECQPRRSETRHGLGRQDGPHVEPRRRQDARDLERAQRSGLGCVPVG